MSTVSLTNAQWTKIEAFLRDDPNAYVGQAAAGRRFVEAILWMGRSGAQGRLLPADYGPWNTIYKRFARWCEQGVWERLLAQVAAEPDLESVLIDSPIVRAHPCAAGAQKKRWSGGSGVGR